ELDLGAGVLAEQELVALLDGQLLHPAVLEHAALADGDDLPLLRLPLGGVGDDDAALGLLLLLDALDEDAIVQRLDLHGLLVLLESPRSGAVRAHGPPPSGRIPGCRFPAPERAARPCPCPSASVPRLCLASALASAKCLGWRPGGRPAVVGHVWHSRAPSAKAGRVYEPGGGAAREAPLGFASLSWSSDGPDPPSARDLRLRVRLHRGARLLAEPRGDRR